MDITSDTEWLKTIKAIKSSDLSDMDKVAQAFEWVTSRVIENGEREVELARALQDRDAVVKEQIKLSMMRHAREIFNDCGRAVLGREFWDE
jgi:hypothetical protein